MIYPDNFEHKLHFDLIRESLKEKCLSTLARERVDQMAYSSDYQHITLALNQTREMLEIVDNEADFPSVYAEDLREAFARIRVEGLYFDENELMALRDFLKTSRALANFFSQREQYPFLRVFTENLSVFPLLIEQIDRVLDKFGRIKDSASPELGSIRREMQDNQNSISRRLNSILRQAQRDGLVEEDAQISLRDGRAVIPINSANKRQLPGIILDESTTGKTSFIEPQEVVVLNNRQRELEGDERREIIRILINISTNIKPYKDEILDSILIVAHLDFLRSKALYARQIEGIMPKVENDVCLEWKSARHPLLFLQLKSQKKEIVPLNIELSTERRILVISGPNAGGKSVCLQTVGIVQYMMQCGMLPPMNEGSRMGIFTEIFIDIGDEQSIENDLSTYSSHLKNMKDFLRFSTEKSLILIDEFGTGTEPMVGGAIAQSVLKSLNEKRVFGVITTHYTNLKHYATETEGIINGAMLFDVHRIEPMFRLEIGQAGSSFAFEIASKIGLPSDVLSDAKELLGQDNFDYDRNLRQIVRDKNYWQTKREKIHQQEKNLEQIVEKYETALKNIKQERRTILEEAREKSRSLLDEANKKIENTIREIRETQAHRERTKEVRKEIEELKHTSEEIAKEDERIEREMEKIRRRKEKKKERKNAPVEEKKVVYELAVGAKVKIDNDEGKVAEVLSFSGKEAVVSIGLMQMNVKTDRLTVISNTQAKKQSRVIVPSNITESVREKKLTFKTDIDIRGMHPEEAIPIIDSFIDEAVVCEVGSVRILHGKGTGVLRQMIRQFLSTLASVERFYDESEQFGGAGITIVELK